MSDIVERLRKAIEAWTLNCCGSHRSCDCPACRRLLEFGLTQEADGQWRSNPVQCPESSAAFGVFERLVNTAEMREWITFVEEEMIPGRRYRIDITEVGEVA